MPSEPSLPKFDAPPVIETVLSAQFDPLPNFTNAHAGWFWKNYLGNEWSNIKSAPRINDDFEGFGEKRKWIPRSQFTLQTGVTSDRLQIIRSDNDQDRMIQVQNSRFVYNWKRQPEQLVYPSYEVLLPEFHEGLSCFSKFVQEADLGELNFNQWEVTYVNHIPKGTLWESISDWVSIIPGLAPPLVTNVEHHIFDSLKGQWQYVIGDNLGRLHLFVDHVRLQTPHKESAEIMEVKFIARGPIDKEGDIDLYSGFELGHTSIVNAFAAITSKNAQKYWKRRQ